MSQSPLTILAGRTAYDTLTDKGWDPQIFDTMVGASGGAKLLGLTYLDRYLFGEYLPRSNHPMELYGSSIGSWRHAALVAPDPLAAITLLQERYLNQSWDEDDKRTPGEVVDELCDWVLDGICTPEQRALLCNHPRFTTHIVTARGLGLNGRPKGVALGVGMGASALGNLASRRLLAKGFQRVVFSSGPAKSFQFNDFTNQHVTLSESAVKPALLASGSIPFLMAGQRDLPAGPKGHYWDGGVIDYHFDFKNHVGQGLVLYPHFSDKIVKGWFDKKLPWRVNDSKALDKVVVIAPSASFLSSLPYQKIPDRNDFTKLSQDERIKYWRKCMDMSQALADKLAQIVDASDPVAEVKLF